MVSAERRRLRRSANTVPSDLWTYWIGDRSRAASELMCRPSHRHPRGGIRSRSASLSNENRGHSGENSSPHHRLDILRREARLVALAKRSFDLEVDRRLFPPIALDFVLGGLSLV